MAAKWIEFLTGSLDEKKAVPAVQGPHRGAARAVRERPRRPFERYFMYNGGITDGDPA